WVQRNVEATWRDVIRPLFDANKNATEDDVDSAMARRFLEYGVPLGTSCTLFDRGKDLLRTPATNLFCPGSIGASHDDRARFIFGTPADLDELLPQHKARTGLYNSSLPRLSFPQDRLDTTKK